MILARRLNAVPQIFKIVAPFVFLSAAVATLNARLGMPPFALFLIALSLTDGAIISSEPNDTVTNQPNPPWYSVMTMTFFFNVTDTGKGAAAALRSGGCTYSPRSRRLVATDRPVDIALLYHFATSRVFGWNSLYWGGFDAGYGATKTPREKERRIRNTGRTAFTSASESPHRHLV